MQERMFITSITNLPGYARLKNGSIYFICLQCICLFIYLFINAFIYLFINVFIYLFINVFIYLFINVRIYLFIKPSSGNLPTTEEAILNSFPRLNERVNMSNKFYQCLVADRMPQKIRKLVVVGPRDSGKTSWAAIFRRIIPLDKIASITYENQFYVRYLYVTEEKILNLSTCF